MSLPREGQRVAYCGDPEAGLDVGDRGKVLSCSTDSSHVLWATGARSGEITLVPNFDLVASQGGERTYDDLHTGSLVTIAVRDVWDGQGKVGLLNALNEEGHLATFASIAEEALQRVAATLRTDPSIIEVLGSLEPEEGDEFVTFTAAVLLRDAFGQED